MLGISIHGCTFHQESDFVSSLTGSLAKDLEIHGFTGTQGTRPNAAPANGRSKILGVQLHTHFRRAGLNKSSTLLIESS